MAEQYLDYQYMSEIRLLAFDWPPRGWAQCDGQLLPINQYQALFSLIGTWYGGDGQTNFALPDFRGRVPVGAGAEYAPGSRGGLPTHTLTPRELPMHMHFAQGTSTAGDAAAPAGNLLATASAMYGPATSLTPAAPTTTGTAGGGRPHENMQPYLTVAFCIALQGHFPRPY